MAGELPLSVKTFSISFKIANATTGESNTDLTRDGGNSLWVAPKAGSIVGIGVACSAAITAGTATFRAHSASTEIADASYPAPVCSSTNRHSYAVVRPRALTFSAGDALGISVTTTTPLDATNTLDFDADLYVAFDND